MEPLGIGDPTRVGPYRLEGRLGGGGMGQVFLGRSAAGRVLAVKVIRPELAADPDFAARFRREVAAARAVSGFYTAPVVDADPQADPPWLATAYVPGPSLSEAVLSNGPLPTAALLALTAGLAEALASVHAAGVIHRDVKPTNVLLADDGPRLIDFGISRAADDASLTVTGTVIGSVAFMSPEQAEGRAVGPAGDVFSLGAVLVFAATGAGPFGSGNTPALLYRVVHAEPELGEVPAGLRDLFADCLAKDPARRPGPAQIIARAVAIGTAPTLPHPTLPPAQSTELRDQPVDARPDAPVPMHMPSPLSAPPLTGTGTGPGSAVLAHEDPHLWRLDVPRGSTAPPTLPASARAEHGAAANLPTQVTGPWPANPSLVGPNHAATPVPSPKAEPARSGLNRRRFLLATGATGLGAVSGVLWAQAGSHPTTPTATGDPTTPTTVGTATWAPAGSTPAGAQAVAFSPDGHTLASGNRNGLLQLWNVTDPAQLTLTGQQAMIDGTDYIFTVLAFSPDGHTLASGSNFGSLQLWNVSNPAQPTTLGQIIAGGIRISTSVAFSSDGHTLAGGNDNGTAQLWNVSDPARPTTLGQPGQPITGRGRVRSSVAFSPDGRTLAIGTGIVDPAVTGTVQLWSISDPTRPTILGQPLNTEFVQSIAFSPDGHTLASVGADTAQLWNVSDPAHFTTLGNPFFSGANVGSVAFSPDGHTLAVGTGDGPHDVTGTVQLWNVSDPADPTPLEQPFSTVPVFSVAFSPDGRTLAGGSWQDIGSPSANAKIQLWTLG